MLRKISAAKLSICMCKQTSWAQVFILSHRLACPPNLFYSGAIGHLFFFRQNLNLFLALLAI
jgi:hypothetical protein